MGASRVALASPLPATPPTEFRIWPFGEITTTKGTFLFDESAARSVLAAWKAYGNRLTVDYEHKAVDPSGRAGDGKSAGSFLIELRDDGLWATDVRWTPPAYTALANKEWLYFSPYFSADEETGRIFELINLALTNIPATTNMTPLVAAHRSAIDMDNDTPNVATTALAGEDDEAPTSRPDAEDAEQEKDAARRAARERMAKLRAALAAAEEEYASLADSDGEEETGASSSEEEETLSSSEEDEDEDEPPKDKPTATSRSVVRSTEASRIVAAASAATGKSNPAEIVGALTALAKTNARNASLSKRLAHLERKLQRSEVESLVSRAIKTGRLTPAERDWAIEYGMDSVAKLRGYLDVTPKRAVMAGGADLREPRGAGAPRSTAGVMLSDVERKICANAGISPEKFAEIRNRPIRTSEG